MPNEKKYLDADLINQNIETLVTYANDSDRMITNSVITASKINNLPAADVTEINHGEWIDKQPYTYNFDNMTLSGTGERCSLCGWINKGGVDKYTNYCPNCGAKMENNV